MTRLNPGARVVADGGNPTFIVDSVISKGTGQGDIYLVHPDGAKDRYAMKLFHSGKRKSILARIKLLEKRGRACSAFVHPLHRIKDGEALGYTMEYLDPAHYLPGSALFNGTKRTLSDGSIIREELPYNVKLGLLYSFLYAASIPYEVNISMGDYKPENVFLNLDTLEVKIIDVDTAVSADSKPVVRGTIGFMSPDVMRGGQPDRYSDAYSLAVIIWMTLISGHPLVGRRRNQPCSQNIDTYLYATNPVYVCHPKDPSNRPEETDRRILARLKRYPKYFLDAMERTFVDGLFDGEKRTTPREWCEIIERLYDDYFICRRCGEEHFYDTHPDKCHVCGSPIEVPIKLVCQDSTASGVYLFNELEIFSDELLGDDTAHPLFRVVVSDSDKRYALLCTSTREVVLTLASGLEKRFGMGDLVPIFLDSTIEIGNHKLNFIGGKTK